MYQLRFLRFGSIPAYLDQILDLVSVSSALGYWIFWHWTSDVDFLDFFGQRLGVFSLRTISVFGPSEPKEPPERAYQVP
ncbi:unnamed protein product [Rhizophagus irregularis]|uniref:Uncharacterized protein n=1 Tax=Rhizophagus irregularis TaxID=588596 RepID=A0A915ZG15_9GLOM|nr:unnamed protein product [Rhizophagus irregularis]